MNVLFSVTEGPIQREEKDSEKDDQNLTVMRVAGENGCTDKQTFRKHK